MNVLFVRRILIQIHLYLAGFLAPAFLLLADFRWAVSVGCARHNHEDAC